MAQATFTLRTPVWMKLRTVVFSHGWVDLPPFAWNEVTKSLRAVCRVNRRIVLLDITQPKVSRLDVVITAKGTVSESSIDQAKGVINEMLGLSHDFAEFYELAGDDFAWAKELGSGPFLRGGSVFEDAVKMLATTNCSWSLTRQMINRLVEELGEKGPEGVRAFPTPEQMAERPSDFYRDVIRTGYRAKFFKEIAEISASGRIDLERWKQFPGTTKELVTEIRQVPGLGRYAAENLCKLLGRFDGLGLDSWCLKKFPMVHGPVRGDVAKAIERHYKRFGAWQGLALWLDLTRDWHEKDVTIPEPFKKK
jgi:3-methyladenine DNA glycosylase/8-oxoguanine DNA glycosylase